MGAVCQLVALSTPSTGLERCVLLPVGKGKPHLLSWSLEVCPRLRLHLGSLRDKPRDHLGCT